MRLLHRYIIREFFLPFLYCLLTFALLYVIVDLITHLDEILRQQVAPGTLAAYYISFLPIIFVQTAPVAVLLSTLFVFANFNRHQELVAMKAAGLSIWKILQPLLFMGILISIATFAVNESMVPQAAFKTAKVKEETIEGKRKQNQPKKINDVTIFGRGNRMYYARRYDPVKKELDELIILKHNQSMVLESKTMVQKAVWTGANWLAENYVKYTLDPSGQVIGQPEVYAETTLDIEEKPGDFLVKSEFRSEFMSYKQLKDYLDKMAGGNKRALRRLLVDLHYKLAFPFISFVIILIGVPFAMSNQRGKAFAGIGMSIAFVLLYYAVNAISIALGKGGTLPPIVAAWLANIFFACLGISLINKRCA
jgi:lipopolysaccharide export system permease protein